MTETTKTATFDALTPAHLDGAVALSRAEGWPHRLEDWALILGLSRGIAALDGDRLVGTAMATPFGPAGTLNMIVVARDWRGRGLARAMLERLMDGEARQWRLIATADGLPLYAKLGFVETHRIVQQQGPVAADRRARGRRLGRGRRHRRHRRPRPRRHRHGPRGPRRGARRRRPPRGHPRRAAASPVMRRCAASAAARWRAPSSPATPPTPGVCSPFSSQAAPAPSSASTSPEASGLGDWLAAQGLAPVGGGIAMIRGGAPAAAPEFQTFALAAQALG